MISTSITTAAYVDVVTGLVTAWTDGTRVFYGYVDVSEREGMLACAEARLADAGIMLRAEWTTPDPDEWTEYRADAASVR